MAGADFVDPLFDRASSVSARTWELAFYLILLAYSLVLFLEVITYRPAARLVPLITVVILLLLLTVRTVTVAFSDRLPVHVVGFFDDMASEFTAKSDSVIEDTRIRYRREIESLIWLAVLLALIWYVGFLVAILVFTPLFTYVNTRDIRFSVITTVVIAAFIYVMFVVLLSSRLWRGALL